MLAKSVFHREDAKMRRFTEKKYTASIKNRTDAKVFIILPSPPRRSCVALAKQESINGGGLGKRAASRHTYHAGSPPALRDALHRSTCGDDGKIMKTFASVLRNLKSQMDTNQHAY